MDPLSDVLSLLKPRSYHYGGFDAGGEWSIQYPRHDGIKCHAVVSNNLPAQTQSTPNLFPFVDSRAIISHP